MDSRAAVFRRAAPVRLVALIALAALTSACAGTGRHPQPAPEPAPPSAPADSAAAEVALDEEALIEGAALEVENNTTLDVRIFVLRSGMPVRLGVVAGLTTAQFELQPSLINREIRLRADPIGGWSHTSTDVMLVRRGQFVSWKLDDRLRSTRLSVY